MKWESGGWVCRTMGLTLLGIRPPLLSETIMRKTWEEPCIKKMRKPNRLKRQVGGETERDLVS